MKVYLPACSTAALVILGVTSASASSLESTAVAIGGQATCGTFGPPPTIDPLFGSFFLVGTTGNGISDCGLKGNLQSLTATHGPLTSTNMVNATVGGPPATTLPGGPYTGISSATSNYGSLSVTAHGTNLGVSNPSGYSQSGGLSIFNDQLTFTSPYQINGSLGSVVYTFTINGALTTPVPSNPSGSENIANLAIRQGDFSQGNIFTADTISASTGTILGNPSYPGFTTAAGSIEGSGQFAIVHIPIVWGNTENLTVGLAVASIPVTGATLDSHLQAVVSGIAVYDSSGQLDSSVKISSSSGSIYSANGVSPIPEPEFYAMFLLGLGLTGFMARRRLDTNHKR